jgi:nicotinate-nucleotide adenylyltransferase
LSVVGILGGSFDPVHRGHVAFADRARRQLSLDRVLLLPCADPPHKPERTLAAAFHRLEMIFLAVEGWAGVGVSTSEIERGGHCYTIDTLRTFRSGPPALQPVFLLGSDALADVGTWRDHEALLAEFDFAVAMRPGDEFRPRAETWPDFVQSHLATIPAGGPELGTGGRVVRLEIPEFPASSSNVRRRASRGEPIDDLVPARVARYIQRHDIYAEEAGR